MTFNIPELRRAADYGTRRPISGTVAFVVNTDRFFLTHRVSWAVSMRASGARVVVLGRNTGHAEQIVRHGLEFINVDLGRESLSPLHALRASAELRRQLKLLSPKVVFLVATAAYTLGVASMISLHQTRFIVTVTGSGRALSRKSLGAWAVKLGLRVGASRTNTRTLFQLESDLDSFVRRGLARRERSAVIPGTGLDVAAWHVQRQPRETTTVLFAARLFREKGVYDFVQAARALSSSRLRFVMAGAPDDGVTSSVTEEELRAWAAEGAVQVVGQQSDMPKLLASADIFVAPSSHPEGTPKSLIEAAASGLAVVAYRQQGVEIVLNDGQAGLLVEPGRADELVNAISSLAADPRRRLSIGASAHAHALATFDVGRVLTELYDFALEDAK